MKINTCLFCFQQEEEKRLLKEAKKREQEAAKVSTYWFDDIDDILMVLCKQILGHCYIHMRKKKTFSKVVFSSLSEEYHSLILIH